MSNPRFTAPQAEVTLQASCVEVPPEIAKKIKGAWVAALVSATLTLVIALIAMNSQPIAGLDGSALVDVVLILGLAFGIYKRSRTCAVIMLLYFVVSKIMMVVETGRASGIVMALVFLWFYWQGVVGTFAWHKHLAQR